MVEAQLKMLVLAEIGCKLKILSEVANINPCLFSGVLPHFVQLFSAQSGLF